jgi:hypothetical protein
MVPGVCGGGNCVAVEQRPLPAAGALALGDGLAAAAVDGVGKKYPDQSGLPRVFFTFLV